MKLLAIKPSESEGSFFENFNKNTVWLSTLDAANFLGISPNALRILVCRGKVRFWKFGQRLRFSQSDLESLLKKGS